MTKKEKEKLEAIKHLKQFIKKGDTIFTKIEKVSTSGMYRHIKVISIKKNNPSYWSYYVAKILEWSYKDKTNAVGVGGCGMDMGFHLVYTLSRILFKDGYALKQRWI
jgi:hypothetical protein